MGPECQLTTLGVWYLFLTVLPLEPLSLFSAHLFIGFWVQQLWCTNLKNKYVIYSGKFKLVLWWTAILLTSDEYELLYFLNSTNYKNVTYNYYNYWPHTTVVVVLPKCKMCGYSTHIRKLLDLSTQYKIFSWCKYNYVPYFSCWLIVVRNSRVMSGRYSKLFNGIIYEISLFYFTFFIMNYEQWTETKTQ